MACVQGLEVSWDGACRLPSHQRMDGQEGAFRTQPCPCSGTQQAATHAYTLL